MNQRFSTGGILRALQPLARRDATARGYRWGAIVAAAAWLLSPLPTPAAESLPEASRPTVRWKDGQAVDQLHGMGWDFGRGDDRDSNQWPDQWKRHVGIGYPKYVEVGFAARNPEAEIQFKQLDLALIKTWRSLRPYFSSLPAAPPTFPDSIVDTVVDRYLRIELDGGQAKLESPHVPISHLYQYRFSCDIMTQRLRHDTAQAALVFLDREGKEIASHSTVAVSGTVDWKSVRVDRLQPPQDATTMLVRLSVNRSEDGLEDIHGVIGFDNLRIDQYPQLQIATDQPRGIYRLNQPIVTTAQVMGLPIGATKVHFRLLSADDEEVANRTVSLVGPRAIAPDGVPGIPTVSSQLTWRLPRIPQGFYRVTAALEGADSSTLSTETTLAVIDRLVPGTPHGSFGWTLPDGHGGVSPRDIGPWLADAGVAWVKYPCWLGPDDDMAAERVAGIFGKLQDAGIQTIGMLDVPPKDQQARYELRGRRQLVAEQLFRDAAVWQPLLEPVMSRLTLKVRTWQLGADRDHSFLGRPRLRESVQQISTGLQGFGQPIDVAISWPWLEPQLGPGASSWQAICRSSEKPLSARELDSYLTLQQTSTRGEGPYTWLLLDPIANSQYDDQARIQDLVLRMATVRAHRVQAAFVSDPFDSEHGLLRPDGRPGKLLLPWRTTSRLIGNLRRVGSLRLRSRAQNAVYANGQRAVLMVWSAEPTEEAIFLGEDVSIVDVWGRSESLPTEQVRGQSVQRLKIGPVPKFVVGADPTLLAFRMSVALDRQQIDSLLGQAQRLAVSFTNPTQDGLIGDVQLVPPDGWMIETPKRSWETLGGRTATQDFDVILGNSAKIGTYEIPLRFELQTSPPHRITVHRQLHVGPEGLNLKVDTRLTSAGGLRVIIEMTNVGGEPQSYDCMLFPPPGRQYQRQFITIGGGETVRREIYWHDAEDLIGKKMLLRAVEQDGRRVMNYAIDVRR